MANITIDGNSLDLACSSEIAGLGDIKEDSISSSVSIPTGSSGTDVCHVYLAAGTWVVTGTLQFASTSTAVVKAVAISQVTTMNVDSGLTQVTSSGVVALTSTIIVELGSTTRLNLCAMHGNSASVNVTAAHLAAVRIK